MGNYHVLDAMGTGGLMDGLFIGIFDDVCGFDDS